MKKLLILGMMFVILLLSNSGSALIPSTASFSSQLELNTGYRWSIENYQVGDRRIETKSTSDAFEFIHGSRIDLTVLKDPSSIDLASRDSLSNGTEYSDYFRLEYDGLTYEFNKADQLYIWIFPLTAIDEVGSNINLITEFWIYNLYNLLLNGETFEFSSELPSSEITSDTTEDEIIVNFDNGDTTIQARVDRATGLMNSINYVSSTPDFRIEIDRRGGGSALPISPLPVVIAFILMPLIIRKLKI